VLSVGAHRCYHVYRECYRSIFCTGELHTWTKQFEMFSVTLDITVNDGSRVLLSSDSRQRIVTGREMCEIYWLLLSPFNNLKFRIK
jgi:hypothetical protein